MTESLDLDALEAVAQAATPGPWKESGLDDEPTVIHYFDTEWSGPGYGPHVYPDKPQDAVHIAAFDPPTVLALIGRVREAEDDLKLARALADQSRQLYDWGSEQRDRAEAAEAVINRVRSLVPEHYRDGTQLMYTPDDDGEALIEIARALGGEKC